VERYSLFGVHTYPCKRAPARLYELSSPSTYELILIFFAMSAMDRCSLLQYLCHKRLCRCSVVRGNVFKLVFFFSYGSLFLWQKGERDKDRMLTSFFFFSFMIDVFCLRGSQLCSDVRCSRLWILDEQRATKTVSYGISVNKESLKEQIGF